MLLHELKQFHLNMQVMRVVVSDWYCLQKSSHVSLMRKVTTCFVLSKMILIIISTSVFKHVSLRHLVHALIPGCVSNVRETLSAKSLQWLLSVVAYRLLFCISQVDYSQCCGFGATSIQTAKSFIFSSTFFSKINMQLEGLETSADEPVSSPDILIWQVAAASF